MFDDVLLAQSAIDRFMNAAFDLVIEGKSYRPRLKPKLEADLGVRSRSRGRAADPRNDEDPGSLRGPSRRETRSHPPWQAITALTAWQSGCDQHWVWSAVSARAASAKLWIASERAG